MRAMQRAAPSLAAPLRQQQRPAGRPARQTRRLAVKMMAAPKQMLVRASRRACLLRNPPAAAAASAAPTFAPPRRAQIYVPPHPLVKHWLGVMRNKDTPAAIFRTAAAGGVCMRRHMVTWEAIVRAPLAGPECKHLCTCGP